MLNAILQTRFATGWDTAVESSTMKRQSTLSSYWPEPKQKGNEDKRSASSNPELEEPQSGTTVSEEDSTCESKSCTVAEQCDTIVSPSIAPNAPETCLVPSEESETTPDSVSHVEPKETPSQRVLLFLVMLSVAPTRQSLTNPRIRHFWLLLSSK